MRNFLTIASLLLAICLNATAQTAVSGRLLSHPDALPLSGATVSVTDRGGKIVTAGVTDKEGRFVIYNIPEGEYDLNADHVGYLSESKHFLAGQLNKALDLGHIFLTQQAIGLSEVEVVAGRRTVASALDRKSYNASELITGAGGSVLEAMKSLPGVTIDQEGKVMLRGSDKVAVLIDGRQSAMTGFGNQRGLENIPMSQIESIEIINNPSARYDAAGMAGIVNIKFKQAKGRGLTGDAGFTFGAGALAKRRSDLPTGMPSYSDNLKYTPSLNLNYKTGKFNLFAQGYWIHQRRLPNNEFTTRIYDNGTVTESQVAENRTQNHYNVKAGLDWNPTPRQTFTLFGLYDYEWHTDTTRVWYFTNRDYANPTRKWGFNESEGTGFTNATLQHKYRFAQPGHELTSQFAFTKGWEDETYRLYQDGPEPAWPVIHTDKTHVLAPEYVWQINSDYVRPLSFGRIEAGVQGRLRHMPITYDMTFVPGNTALIYDFGNWSKWDENIAGAYANLVAELRRFDIEAGLRGEYTSVTYKFAPNQYFHDDSYSYFDLFPNVRFTFKATRNYRTSLFYNRRIDRPGEDILRIFPKYDDPELLKVGNPSLRPQYTQSVEWAHRYSWRSGSVFATLYFKDIKAPYTRIYLQDILHPEITVKAYDNVGRATNAGFEVAADQKIGKIWNLTASFNLYRNTIFAYSGTIDFPVPQPYSIPRRTDNPFFAKLGSRVLLPWNMQLQVDALYFSARNIPQGRELARGGIDAGLKKGMLKGRLELNLTATDIFNTMGIRQNIDGNGFRVKYQNYYESQVISLGAKYKF